MNRILIFANGELPDINKTRAILKDDDYIICADGGTRHASALDLKPDLVIGDMDSTEKTHLKKLRDEGVQIELFPRDKNKTDLELAVQRALEMQPKEIVVVAALGGRLDQTLGNISLLTTAQLSEVDARLDDGVQEIFFCRFQVEIHGRIDDIVSLIPWHGKVSGIHTKNLQWPLAKETLFPDKTRGISNKMTADVAEIKISSGVLLIVHIRNT